MPKTTEAVPAAKSADSHSSVEDRRVTIKMPPAHYEVLEQRAQRRGITVAEMLRRDASFAKALDRYIDDDTLTVIDPQDERAVHLHLVQ